MSLDEGSEPTSTEIILDHARRRVGYGVPDKPLASARLITPTCGDAITVALVESERGAMLRWEGRGCEVSQASASMLAELGPDAPVLDFLEAMRTGASIDGLGDAAALLAVSGNPVRSACATLAWRALQAARETGQ